MVLTSSLPTKALEDNNLPPASKPWCPRYRIISSIVTLKEILPILSLLKNGNRFGLLRHRDNQEYRTSYSHPGQRDAQRGAFLQLHRYKIIYPPKTKPTVSMDRQRYCWQVPCPSIRVFPIFWQLFKPRRLWPLLPERNYCKVAESRPFCGIWP